MLPARTAPRGRGNAIELRNVSFRYPGKKEWALRNLSLKLEPGEKLFVEGTVDAMLYVMASGILEFTCQVATPSASTIGCIGAGEYVGEIGLLTGAPHAATATALTHCRVYHLPHDALAPLLSDNPELASAFEKAVRHGLDVLHRHTAARLAGNIDLDAGLLPRIRNFFRFRSALKQIDTADAGPSASSAPSTSGHPPVAGIEEAPGRDGVS